MPRGNFFIGKPAAFAFLLITFGASAAAIASGIAEREARVYDVAAVQRTIQRIGWAAGQTTPVGPPQELDLSIVERLTWQNCRQGVAIGRETRCSRAR